MNAQTKMYATAVFVLGVISLIFQVLFADFYVPYYAIIYIVLIFFAEKYGSVLTEDIVISYSASIILFLLLTFGYWSAVLAIFSMIIVSTQRVFQNNKKQDATFKLMVNLGSCFLSLYSAYWIGKLLQFDTSSLINSWKLIIIISTYMLVNLIIISTAASLFRKKPQFDIVRFDKNIMFHIYTPLMTTYTVFAFADRGIFGTLLVYILFVPITQISQLYARMKSQEKELFIDSLTKAYNYKFFEIAVQKRIDTREKFTLLIIDLDRFKQINDTFGHCVGNKALENFSRFVRSHLGKNDLFCRFGGDEFCIITDNPARAKVISEGLIADRLKCTTLCKGKAIHLDFSIGIYECDGDMQTVNDALDKADNAMYQAKRKGGNCVVAGGLDT